MALPAKMIKFPVSYAAQKRTPLLRREPEDRPRGVPAVANADRATGQARHLDAVAVGVTQRALDPVRTCTPSFRSATECSTHVTSRWLVSFLGTQVVRAASRTGFQQLAAPTSNPPPPRDRRPRADRAGTRGRNTSPCRPGTEGTPFGRQARDQDQPASGVRIGWSARAHRQGTRLVVDIDTQLLTGAPDGQRDGLTIPVRDGIGHQVAGEQDRDVEIDGDLPLTDGRADLAAGRRRRGWFPGKPDSTLIQFGRTSRCHHVYPVPQLTLDALR